MSLARPASAVGRGARFLLVAAALMAWGGPPMERHLHRHVDYLGWIRIGLVLPVILLH